MNTEILGVILMYATVLVLAIPLGRYIGKIFNYENTWLDKIFNPIDNIFYKLSGINPSIAMNWKQHLLALLIINAFWFVIALFVLSNMSWLPLNPDGNPSMSWDLAFNTALSFVSNTNLQHYSGETGMSYFGQLILMLW
nr:potassium-transporting ATPase subunit KdpA [Saprospiraceae bacterium]